MFSVHLKLPKVRLQGIEGLDFRRRMHLSDSESVSWFVDDMMFDLQVPEHIARTYFDMSQERDIVTVSIALLQPGDLQDYDAVRIAWNALTRDRALELYEAVKYAQLRDTITSLKQEIVSLRDDLMQYEEGDSLELLNTEREDT